MDRTLSDQAEPTLDLVQPGGIRGCVMQVKTRMSIEMSLDVLAYNLKRATQILGIPPLMHAIRA